MHFVYILESKKNGRWYVGYTSDLAQRIAYHNAGKVRSTKPYFPYELIYLEQYETITAARERELQIKRSGIIRKAIKSRIEKYGPIV